VIRSRGPRLLRAPKARHSRLFVVVLLACGPARAGTQDSRATSNPATRPADAWAEFRGGPFNTGVASGPTPSFARIAWRRATISPVLSQPAAIDGRVYVATVENLILCFDAATGEPVFERRLVAYERNESGLLMNLGCGYSSPLVANGRLYVGNENGYLYAIDAKTGEPSFAVSLGGRIWASPKTNGRVVCVSNVDAEDSACFGVDAVTGVVRWKVVVGYPIGASAALIGNQAWIPTYGSRFLTVDLDTGKHEIVPVGFSSMSTPAVALGRLFLRTREGKMTSFDLLRRDVVWANKEPGDFDKSAPACDGDRAYFSAPGGVRAYDPLTGARLWEYPLLRSIESSPVVTGDYLVFGAIDRNLYVLDRAKGTLVTYLELGEDLKSSVAIYGGRAYVGGGSKGALFAIE
jgi:outer membrane protein assembly factor BamB